MKAGVVLVTAHPTIETSRPSREGSTPAIPIDPDKPPIETRSPCKSRHPPLGGKATLDPEGTILVGFSRLAQSFAQGNESRNEVFVRDERWLSPVVRRHLRASRLLQSNDELFIEAKFHANMAAECLVKLMFCLARHSLGVRADLPAAFGSAVLARKHGHNIMDIVKLMQSDTRLGLNEEHLWQKLLVDLPKGASWVEERYRTGDVSPERQESLQRLCDTVEQIHTKIESDNAG